jgi:hypothetical protein
MNPDERRRLCLVCLDTVPPADGILIHGRFLVCSVDCFFDLHVMFEMWEEETGKSYPAFLAAVKTIRERGSTPIYQQHLAAEWRVQ